MISHKLKFIFVHIPKTGGVSVQSQLRGYAEEWYGRHSRIGFYTTKSQSNLCDYFKFTIVRNPWCRIVSCYHFLKKSNIIPDVTFTEWVTQKKCNSFTTRWECKSSLNWITVKGHNKMDFVARFENLESDFKIICEGIGIDNKKLPHFNKSKHKNYQSYYDDITENIVKNKYIDEILQFGYKFGD
ncbi:MAG: hypothetical protein CBC02_009840 [Flavobacteriaceae bacterium TMED42]|nr:MAG: hypothetical protein CBC02_009840 [Flavobacteriaceae bacterium TMED42]|tara:strand:- start:2339 stop:2893 length:555 start_codon:yes stop_codon:yes gene_type:complete